MRPQIEHPHFARRQLRRDAAQRIGGEGEAGIGGAHQAHPLFHGAQPRMMGMLGRPHCIGIEPGVIGEVEQELGAARIAQIAGKDDFVANQDQGRRCVGQAHQPAARIAGRPAFGAGDELGHAQTRKDGGEGQIFAEWHQMGLVIGGHHFAIAIDGDHRIIGRLARRGAVESERPARHPGNEARLIGQHAGNARQRLGIGFEEKWQARFGPDQMGDVVEPLIGGVHAHVREHDQPVHQRHRIDIAEIGMFIDQRLHQPQSHVLPLGRDTARQTVPAIAELGGDDQKGEEKRGQAARPIALIGRPDQGRGHSQERGEKAQPIDADDRGQLHHLVGAGEAIAQKIEGKAGEEMAAREFGRPDPGGKRQDPGPAMAPEQMREGAGQAPEQGDQRREAGNGKGHGRQDPATIDEEGGSQPVKGDEKIAPAKGKADGKGRPEQAAPATKALRPVQRPHPDRHGEEQERQ